MYWAWWHMPVSQSWLCSKHPWHCNIIKQTHCDKFKVCSGVCRIYTVVDTMVVNEFLSRLCFPLPSPTSSQKPLLRVLHSHTDYLASTRFIPVRGILHMDSFYIVLSKKKKKTIKTQHNFFETPIFLHVSRPALWIVFHGCSTSYPGACWSVVSRFWLWQMKLLWKSMH